MKIAILGTHGIPARYGGFETCAEEISIRLVQKGHEVVVYSKSDDPAKAPTEYKGVRLKQFPKFRRQYADYAYHGFITTLDALASDADVLHFFGCDHVPFALLARLAGKKVVLTVNGLEWRRMGYPFIYKAYLRSFAELAMVFPHATVADSRSSQSWYAERTGVSPEYIPYGTTISSTVDEKVLAKYNLERDRYVLFVGRLVYEKGIHTLVEGFARVKTDMKLVIIGGAITPGSYVDNLKKKADERVVFLGYVHGSDYESIRNAARVYVHPSLFDGTSISLLGAMGAARSVLSSDLRENVDVGGNGVLFFEKENSADLAAKLQELLDSPSLGRDWGNRALSRAKSLPSWDDIARSYEAVYNNLLKR